VNSAFFKGFDQRKYFLNGVSVSDQGYDAS